MTVTVSESTFSEIRAVRELLRQRLEEIAAMTKDYPVVITFAGYRFVFESKADVLGLIEKLEGAITSYEQAAG